MLNLPYHLTAALSMLVHFILPFPAKKNMCIPVRASISVTMAMEDFSHHPAREAAEKVLLLRGRALPVFVRGFKGYRHCSHHQKSACSLVSEQGFTTHSHEP